MGWCYEFGPQVGEGCDHPMTAGQGCCTCAECGAVCIGRFGGCEAVWAWGDSATVAVRARRPADLRRDDRGGAAAVVTAIDIREAQPVVPPARESVGDAPALVLEWLRNAFDEVHAELRSLRAGLDRQQHAAADPARSSDDLRRSVAEVRELTDQLRVELARLAAFGRALAGANPEAASLVNASAARAELRHRRL